MHWVPARTFCRPSTVASWPVTGTCPARPFFCRIEITDPASPSLAAYTPSTLPSAAVYICSKMVTALSLSQSGTACSPTILTVGTLSTTECAPPVNSVALLSVGDPLRNNTFDCLPARQSTSPCPCSWPTLVLSNDTYTSADPPSVNRS